MERLAILLLKEWGNYVLGTVANLVRSWSAGLALAGFSTLEDLVLGQVDMCD